MSCCRDQLYNKNVFVCCGNELLHKWNKGISRVCCGGRLYNETQNKICCGDIQINKSTHFCCTNKPGLKSSGMDCCFGEPFNPTTHRCEDDRVIQLTKGLCGDTSYDVKSSMKCCDEKLHNISKIKDPVECCGKELYSIFSQQCCKGTNFRAPKDEQCCGQASINSYSHICCNGVKYSRMPTTLACCGNQTYNSVSEDCCGINVYNKSNQHCCGEENVAMVGEDCCGTNAYSIVKQFCCNKTGKYTVINKTSSLNKSLNGESKCPGYRFAIKCGKTQLNGKKEPCCNSRVSKNDHLNGQTVCSQLEENTSRNQTMTERRKTRNRVRHGICRICSLNTNSLLSLIKKQKVSVCRKKVILLAVDTSNRIGRYWMLNVTASYPNSTREGSAEFNLKVLLPCTKCSKLQSKVTNYLLLTQSRVVPGKLLRLGDSDFLFPNKTTKTDTYLRITNQQAKCKDNRNVFVNALKKRMRKGLKKFLKELFQFKLR